MSTTIKMDVPVVESAHKQLANLAQQLRQELQQARTQVKNTVHTAWEGKSALQFEQQFDQWATQTERAMDQLDELLRAMRREIDEWVRMSSTL